MTRILNTTTNLLADAAGAPIPGGAIFEADQMDEAVLADLIEQGVCRKVTSAEEKALDKPTGKAAAGVRDDADVKPQKEPNA